MSLERPLNFFVSNEEYWILISVVSARNISFSDVPLLDDMSCSLVRKSRCSESLKLLDDREPKINRVSNNPSFYFFFGQIRDSAKQEAKLKLKRARILCSHHGSSDVMHTLDAAFMPFDY